jgi:hypothetical protein
VAGNASAEIEYELHTGYSSDYLFRGANVGNDLVEVGVDMATEWNGLGLSAGAWYGSFNETVNIASVGPARPLDTASRNSPPKSNARPAPAPDSMTWRPPCGSIR